MSKKHWDLPDNSAVCSNCNYGWGDHYGTECPYQDEATTPNSKFPQVFSDPGDYIPDTNVAPNLSAISTQVGGDHYKSLAIQPIEYITKNNLGWCEGNIVKYITRWKQKGGKADIDKVIHYANLLKEMN